MNKIHIQKNDEYLLDITDLGTDGTGIGHIKGFALFIKDTVPGDYVRIKVIKLKKNFGYGKLIEILKPSKDRVESKCPVAKQCGGCQLQHLSYEKQLEYKQNKVKNCLERIGGCNDFIMEPILGMDTPYHYRNKAQFPVGKAKDGTLAIGFYAGRTHSIVDTKTCCIQAEINEKVMALVRKFLEKYQLPPYEEKNHTGLIRHILTRAGFATKELMVCLVINGDTLPYQQEFITMLTEKEWKISKSKETGNTFELWNITSIVLNINKEKTNVIMGEKCIFLWGKKYIIDTIGPNTYRISPLSFYQVNPIQTKKLYDLALEFAGLTGKEIVWDLYCGTGTISLFLARHAKKVYGVEIVPQAIKDAKENAILNGIENVDFICGAAELILPEWYQRNSNIKADIIVLDPPRKGCDEKLLMTIAAMKSEKIVYISCDPATLSRDIRILEQHGYSLKKVRACDMFGNSVHVETVVLIQRKDT